MTIAQRLVTESEWMGTVGDLLDAYQWAWIHHNPGRRAHGKWASPVQGNSAVGWPDLFAIRGERAVAIELKRDGNKPAPAQEAWLARLRGVGIEAHVATLPADFHFLDQLLRPDPEQLSMPTSNSTAASYVADRR